MTLSDKRSCYLFPKTIGEFVESLTRPVMKAKGLAGTRVLTQWDDIVGEQLSRHTLPEKLAFPKGGKTGGTLTISVENGFATELQHMQPAILERLAHYFGYQAVTRIVISHTWVPSPQRSEVRVEGSGKKKKEVYHTSDIEDAELKAALASFAKTLSDT
jgi:hypothetical protein